MILFLSVTLLTISLMFKFYDPSQQPKACVKHRWTMKRRDGTIEDYLVCGQCGQTPEDILGKH